MKKTFNINIGNSIIHIEEDAYELLTNYLIEVKQHFGKSADDFEIVSDIENRIAEMFIDILASQQKKVIERSDVEVVIGLMGSVKDFDDELEDEPASDEPVHAGPAASGDRKIYRDTEEAMIAGVCSGLSHYLKMDVSVLRIIFAFAVFLGGSGLLAYLILWVTIPRAITRSEKMAMKGEAVNLQGFKRSFEEELSNLRDNLNQAGDHLEPMIKRSGSFITEFSTVLGTFVGGVGQSIIKLIAIVIVIMSSVMFLGAVISLAALLGFWDSSTNNELFPFNIIDEEYITPFLFAAFVTIVIPLLALILLSIRVAFNSRAINKTFSYGLLLIWLGGVSVGIYYIAKISYEFKDEAEFTEVIPLKNFSVYRLDIDQSRFFTKEDSIRYKLNASDYANKVIQNGRDNDHPFTPPRNVSISVEKSDNNQSSLTESYRSQGLNFEIALNHAKNIKYDFSQADSVLRFGTAIHLKKNAKWRDQNVQLVLRLPVGTKVVINRDLFRYLQRSYSFWECEDIHGYDLFYGIMTEDGLKCAE